MGEVERSRLEQHDEHEDNQNGRADQDGKRQPIAHQDVDVPAGKQRPLPHRPNRTGDRSGPFVP